MTRRDVISAHVSASRAAHVVVTWSQTGGAPSHLPGEKGFHGMYGSEMEGGGGFLMN